MCNTTVQFLLQEDRDRVLYYAPLQGETFKQVSGALLSESDFSSTLSPGFKVLDTMLYGPVIILSPSFSPETISMFVSSCIPVLTTLNLATPFSFTKTHSNFSSSFPFFLVEFCLVSAQLLPAALECYSLCL